MRTLLYLIYFLGHIELQSGAEPQIYCGMISHDFTLSCKFALSRQAAIVYLSHNLSMSSVNHFQNNSSSQQTHRKNHYHTTDMIHHNAFHAKSAASLGNVIG